MQSIADVWRVQQHILVESFTLVIVNITTMICYPGVILQTRLSFVPEESWFQVIMLSLFSVSDIFGRFLTKYVNTNHRKARCIFVLLSLLRAVCIYSSLQIGFNEDEDSILNSDWIIITNTLILGLGNGFLGTILMMIGPYRVSSS